jgi:hypothetical protein
VIDLQKLQEYVVAWHGDEPYDVHLGECEAVLDRFGYLPCTHPDLHAGMKMHDGFEDRSHVATPLDVLLFFLQMGWTTADDVSDVPAIRMAMRLSDEPGPDRKTRKKLTYPKIVEEENAIIGKLADRIANVERGGKLDKYKAEYPGFRKALYRKDCSCQPMWDHLDVLMGRPKR